MARRIEQEYVVIDKASGVVDKATKKIKGDLNTTGAAGTAAGSMMFAGFSKANVAIAGGVASTALLVKGVSSVVDSYGKFETALTNVATLVDTSVVDMGKLKKEILDLPNILGSATKNTEALYQAISAGVDPEKAVAFVAESAKAATAGLTDSLTAVEGATSVLNAYGISAEKVVKINDQMFTAVKLGKTTYKELADSIGQVAPLAKQTGVSTQELFSAISAITKGGIKTSEAITSINGALTNIIKPSGDAKEVAKELGIEFDATALKSKGLAGFLKEVREKAGGNTEAMGKLFGSIQGLKGMLALTGEAAKDFDEILVQMGNSSGVTEEAFQKQAQTYKVQVAAMNAAFEKLSVVLGESIVPLLTKMIDLITKFVEGTKGAVEGFKETAKSIGRLGSGKLEHAEASVGVRTPDRFSPEIKQTEEFQKAAAEYIKALEEIKKTQREFEFAPNEVMKEDARELQLEFDKLVFSMQKVKAEGGKFNLSEEVTKDLEKVKKANELFKSEMEDVNKWFESQKLKIRDQGIGDGDRIRDVLDIYEDKVEDIRDAFNDIGDKIKIDELEEALEVQGKLEKVQALALAYAKLRSEVSSMKGEGVADVYEDLDEEVNEHLEKVKKLTKQYEKMLKEISTERGAEVIIQFKGEGSAVAPLSDKINQMSGEMDEFFDGVERGTPKVQIPFVDESGTPMTDVLNSMSNSFEDVFMGIVQGTESAKEGFKGMVVAMLKDLAKLGASKAFGALISNVGGFFAGGMGGGTGGMVIPAMAGGGTAIGGRAHLVGENGPELFVPKNTGTVIPGGMSSGGGSPTINITNNVNVGGGNGAKDQDQNSKQRMGMNIAQMIANQTKMTLLQETRPGGILNQRAR